MTITTSTAAAHRYRRDHHPENPQPETKPEGTAIMTHAAEAEKLLSDLRDISGSGEYRLNRTLACGFSAVTSSLLAASRIEVLDETVSLLTKVLDPAAVTRPRRWPWRWLRRSRPAAAAVPAAPDPAAVWLPPSGWQQRAAVRKIPPVPPVSPVVVDSRTSDPGKRAAALERELEPVITIMHRTGLAAAGFKVTGPWETDIDNYGVCGSRDEATRERLLLARTAIRAAARQDGTFWSLPDAILFYRGLAVELFGADQVGLPWQHTRYGSGRVSLVTAEESQTQREVTTS